MQPTTKSVNKTMAIMIWPTMKCLHILLVMGSQSIQNLCLYFVPLPANLGNAKQWILCLSSLLVDWDHHGGALPAKTCCSVKTVDIHATWTYLWNIPGFFAWLP